MGGFEEKAAVINIFDNDHRGELIDKYCCWSIKSKFDGDGDNSVGDD